MADPNDEILDDWRRQLVVDGKRPRTIAFYLTEARRFASWLRDHDRGGDLVDVSRRDVLAWVEDLRNEGRAASTVRNRWVVLRSLYRWLEDEQEVEASPLAKVTVPKPEPPPPDVLTEAELAALLDACKGRDFTSVRDLAVIRVLAATGLRISELCGLHLTDHDKEHRILSVRDGKGGRPRVVRYDPGTATVLDRYRRARGRHKYADRPELFLGQRGPLQARGLPWIFERRAKIAGIGHVHAHQLRHTWAHRWLAAGGAEGDLQRLGGWSNSDVMRRYGSAQADDRALAAYDRIGPMEGL